jgi:hypothetical protein
MPLDDDARSYSRSNNSDGAACSTMGCSHHHMPLVRCNAMAWRDETKEEGARLKVLVTRSDKSGDGGNGDTVQHISFPHIISFTGRETS